jgi:hypothetical protein
VPASDTLSILGDFLLASDAAYLGHMANDGACPDFALPALGVQEGYQSASFLRVNAEHITVEGCHVVTRALRPICAGDEIFVSYGYGYWLSRQFSA